MQTFFGSDRHWGPHGRRILRLVMVLAALGVLHATGPIAYAGPRAAALESEEDDLSPDARFTVIRAGKVITVSGSELRNATIVIADGKIRNVGQAIKYPGNAKVIDARDRVVMPGLINPSSRFRLPRYRRTGVHANQTVASEFFSNDYTYERLRETGYTLLALRPDGRGIPGRGMVVRTMGPTDQQVVVETSYVYIDASKRGLRSALEQAQKEIEKVAEARKKYEEKKEQAREEDTPPPSTQPVSQPTTQPAASQPAAFEPPKIRPELEPLVALLEKREGYRALVVVDNASEYLHVREVLKKHEIAHDLMLRSFQSTDFFRVAETLGEAEAHVVVRPYINTVPNSAERYLLVKELEAAGCTVSVMPSGDNEYGMGVVLQRLSESVREGWSRTSAFKSVTLHPAKLLGLDDRFGSIERGKVADLILLDADPLRPGARVREVMINGEIVHRADEEQR